MIYRTSYLFSCSLRSCLVLFLDHANDNCVCHVGLSGVSPSEGIRYYFQENIIIDICNSIQDISNSYSRYLKLHLRYLKIQLEISLIELKISLIILK